jgi:hypothetical protein
MKPVNILFFACFLIVLATPMAKAQDGDESSGIQIRLHSAGVQFGVYSPSFEYYRSQSFWDFPKAMGIFNADLELKFHRFLGMRAGVGYGSTSSTVNRGPAFGSDETLKYDFIPITVSVLPQYGNDRLTVFAGPSVDFMHIRSQYTSLSYDSKVGGNTMVYGGLAGVSYRILPGLDLSIQGRYVVGEYTKLFITNATTGNVFEEPIDLTGPQISVGVRRRLR